MASETRTYAHAAPSTEVWPPDDTEESVLGTNLHQTTIINLRWGINESARLSAPAGQPVPWEAVPQLLLLGCQRPDDTFIKTYPDVFVYLRPIGQDEASFKISVDGPPALIVEVLSDATQAVDLNLERGKGYSYARAGVREYLALDTSGAFTGGDGRGWRLEGGVYRPWERRADGRWYSEQIDVAIGLQGVWATVYTRDGRRMPREGEFHAELARKDAELARKDAELARRDEQEKRKDAELAAELARKDAEQAAELARKDAEQAAELAHRAEQEKRKDAEQVAELARKDAELAALQRQLDRMRGEHL